VTDDKGATGTTTVPVTVNADRPPVASLTTAVADRTVSVDASASSDPDGKVAALAWDFGDGSTGTGATATHTYAADGTYTVTVTVTDDAGVATTEHADVTVWLPQTLAEDAFDRTVTGGLGTAGTGGAWTASAGATRQSVTPGAAALALTTGTNTGSYLGDVSQTSADVTTSVSLSAAPTGTGTAVYVVGRRVGTNQEYRARLRFLPNGTVGIALTKLAGTSSEALIGSEVIVPGLTYPPGAVLDVRVRVVGTGTTQLAASVWAHGATEPGTPTVSRTDDTGSLQVAGSVGLSAYLYGSATAPNTVTFSRFAATVAH
jgi:PKD repeat protein